MTDAVCDSIRVSSQVYPELGKLASDGGLAHSSQAPSSERHARTKSEEDEYQYQQSVELMRREQMQNDILLDTVKRIQVRGCWSRPLGHSFDSLVRLAHSTRSFDSLIRLARSLDCQGSSAGSLYENEIALLRTVIEQKQVRRCTTAPFPTTTPTSPSSSSFSSPSRVLSTGFMRKGWNSRRKSRRGD